MSRKPSNLIPRALIAPGLVLGSVLALALVQTVIQMGGAPPALAGQVQKLQPAEDRDLPEGSQIQKWRLQETETKVQEMKRQLREAAPAEQQQKQAPQTEAPAPQDQSPE